MSRLFVRLLLACCMATVTMQAIAQPGATGGNPNNNVPYGAGSAQTPPTHATPATDTYSGCVQRLPTDKDTLVISAASVCAVLDGKVALEKLDGHQVDLKGVLTPRTSSSPASLRIDAVVSVGKACTDICSPRPPKSRGLGKGGEIPGKQGGTPGATPAQPPPAQ